MISFKGYISEDAGLALIGRGFDSIDRSLIQLGWLTGRDADLSELIGETRSALSDLEEGLSSEFNFEANKAIADELRKLNGLVSNEIQPRLEPVGLKLDMTYPNRTVSKLKTLHYFTFLR